MDAKQIKNDVPKMNGVPVIPAWVNEDYFVDVLEENFDDFRKIVSFDARPAGIAGESYASVMFKVNVQMELKDGSNKNQTFMLKTILQDEQGAMALSLLEFFPQEQTMYSSLIPDFEQMYRDVGKEIKLAPKSFQFKKDPGEEYVLMEDLSVKGFKNVDRLKGLDQEHTESVLKLLAELHAASAVRYEKKGKYSESFMSGIVSDTKLEMLKAVMNSLQGELLECLAKHPTTCKYVERVRKIQHEIPNLFYNNNSPGPDEIGVINHGDLWANNILFRHNDEGKIEETVLIDFQLARYSLPSYDLFYFLFSSTELELKLAHFDSFVKYYHDHLVENLKLLNYPKKLPSLKDLHAQLLKLSFWGVDTVTRVMASVLLDPNENVSFDKFIEEGGEGKKLRMQMFGSPRYIKHMGAILPWLESRGFLVWA